MRGICFKEHLLHQSAAGIKTQTRRTISIPKRIELYAAGELSIDSKGNPYLPLTSGEAYFPKPQYKVDQYYYIKEPYFQAYFKDQIRYKYDFAFDHKMRLSTSWVNKLFMPERCARHFILIEKVEVEYLNQISKEDVIAEGIDHGVDTFDDDRFGKVRLEYFSSYAFNKRTKRTQAEAYETFGPAQAKYTGPMAHLDAFGSLIDRINGQGFWESNPLVWKYTYKHLTKQQYHENTTNVPLNTCSSKPKGDSTATIVQSAYAI